MNQTVVVTPPSSSSQVATTVPFLNEASIALLLFTIWFFENITEKCLKTSPLLGAITAGVLVGPILQIAPYTDAFSFLGKLGVMLLVLQSSLDVEIEQVKKIGLEVKQILTKVRNILKIQEPLLEESDLYTNKDKCNFYLDIGRYYQYTNEPKNFKKGRSVPQTNASLF